MVKRISNRNIVTERDRYGGYSNEYQPPRTERYVEIEYSKSHQTEDIRPQQFGGYSTLEMTAPKTDPWVNTSAQKQFVTIEVPSDVKVNKYTQTPMMQSIHRPNSSVSANENTQDRPKGKVKAFDKTALVIYLAVMIAIIAAVIATGVALTSVNNRNEELSGQVQNMQSIVNTQQTELNRLSDPNYILEVALNGGMEAITEYRELNIIDLEPPRVYEMPTNWFDSLARFISGMFGG